MLQRKHSWDLVEMIYRDLPDGPYKRGYKSPSDIYNKAVLRVMRDCFPETKLLIGIRHPVKWFESFYNYRVQNGFVMPPAQFMEKNCVSGQHGVCLERSRFYFTLAKLGKTALNGSELNVFEPYHRNMLLSESPKYIPNPIFIYDTSQLNDENETRSQAFRRDLAKYLGLSQELPPPLHYSPGHSLNETEQARRDSLKIDICQPKYWKLRAALTRNGKKVELWIQTFLLQSKDVLISNPEHFLAILEDYKRDPCN